MSIIYKNIWGAAGSGVDQQRADLFRVSINVPAIIGGNAGIWDSQVAWAVEKFPFPPREREAQAIKYLNQTNFQIGADTESSPIEMAVRYAFAQPTAALLEQWHQATSNSQTGGVALTSAIKTNGTFYWLVPTATALTDTNGENNLALLAAYYLEGVWIKGYSPETGADHTSKDLVNLKLVLQIDRYYPQNAANLQISAAAIGVGVAAAGGVLIGAGASIGGVNI
jgi:hypothetical protein